MDIPEIINKIISYLSIKYALRLLSISRFYRNLTKSIFLDRPVYLNEIIVDKIATVIPKYVSHLKFYGKFNQSLTNVIPNSITHLTFGKYFNQPITNTIPNNIKYLIFG